MAPDAGACTDVPHQPGAARLVASRPAAMHLGLCVTLTLQQLSSALTCIRDKEADEVWRDVVIRRVVNLNVERVAVGLVLLHERLCQHIKVHHPSRRLEVCSNSSSSSSRSKSTRAAAAATPLHTFTNCTSFITPAPCQCTQQNTHSWQPCVLKGG
jgi:hypothetical protein